MRIVLLAIIFAAVAGSASADAPDPTALKAYKDFSVSHPGWQPIWAPNGPAWSLVRKRNVPGPYNKPVSIEQTAPTRVNNSRDMLLLDPIVIDPFVSPALGEMFNFSVTADFKLVKGIQPLANPSYFKHDHPISFWFETKVEFTSPSGTTIAGGSYRNALGQGAYCTSGPNDHCMFASQPLSSVHELPMEAATANGIWQYSAEISLVQETQSGPRLVVYSGTVAGAFLVDNSPPEALLVSPAPDSNIAYPVGAMQLTFSYGDPGNFPSGVDTNSIVVTVGGNNGYISEVTTNSFTADVDLSGLEGEIPVTVWLMDRAGNSFTSAWSFHIARNTNPIIAAQQFLQQIAPTLGIQDLNTVALSVTYTTESPDPVYPSIYTLRFEQIGPGGLPVEGSGLTVDVWSTGEVVGVTSDYQTEMQTRGAPIFNYSRQDAIDAALYEAQSLGSAVDATTATVSYARWARNDTNTFVPVLPVRVWVDGNQPFVIAINVETGNIERAVLDLAKDFPIQARWTYPAPLGSNYDPAQHYLMAKSGWYDIYFHANMHDASPFFSENNKLRNYYIVQGGDANLVAQGSGPYEFGPWSLETEIITTMVWTARLNSMTNNVSALRQSEFAHAWWRQTASTSPCWGFAACTNKDGIHGTGLEYHYNVSGVTGKDSNNVTRTTGYGAAPGTIVHETTHGILYAAGIDASSSPYAWAFHEGFAQANSCLAFGDCFGIRTPSSSDFQDIYGVYHWFRDNWGLTNDPHKAGALMTAALQDVGRRLELYSASYKEYKGFDAAWGIPNRIWTGNSDPQLGRTATYLKQGLAAGRLPGLFLSQFDSEILYSYTWAYMPIGNKVSQRPDEQKTVAWRFKNIPFSGLVGPTTKEQPIEVVGYRGTSFRLRFYLTDPLGPNPVECTDYPLGAVAQSLGNVPFLGYAEFSGAAVGEAIQTCKDVNFFLFFYRNCAPMKIFIVAEAISAGQVMARTTDRTDVLGYMPYVRYQGTPDSCACYNDCDGCTVSKTGFEPQDANRALTLIVFPLGYMLLRRFRRKR